MKRVALGNSQSHKTSLESRRCDSFPKFPRFPRIWKSGVGCHTQLSKIRIFGAALEVAGQVSQAMGEVSQWNRGPWESLKGVKNQ